MRAARESRSISSTRSSRPRSIETAPRQSPPRGASTPPTTLEPPPYGIATRRAPAHQSSTRATSASSRGNATTSGGCEKSRAKGAHDVAERLAVGVPGAVVGSLRADRASAAGGATRGARSAISSRRGGGAISGTAMPKRAASSCAIARCCSALGPSPSYAPAPELPASFAHRRLSIRCASPEPLRVV